jgi:hypothetical protein
MQMMPKSSEGRELDGFTSKTWALRARKLVQLPLHETALIMCSWRCLRVARLTVFGALLRKPRRTPTRPRSPSPPGSSSATRCATRCGASALVPRRRFPSRLLVLDERRRRGAWVVTASGRRRGWGAGEGGEPRHRLHGDQRRHLQEVERPRRGALLAALEKGRLGACVRCASVYTIWQCMSTGLG